MKSTFNASRFGKYFVHDLKSVKDNAAGLFLMGIVSPLILFFITRLFRASGEGNLLFLFTDAVKGPSDTARIILFLIMTMLFVAIFPAKAYGGITSKAEGTAWLMLPASRFEKYLSMLLCCLVVAPVIFLAGSLLADGLVCLVDRSCGNPVAMEITKSDYFQFHAISSDGMTWNAPLTLASVIVTNLSVFLLGALLIRNRRWKVVGTILTIFALEVLFVTIIATLATNGAFDHLQWLEEWLYNHRWMFDRLFNIIYNIYLVLLVGGCALAGWARIKKIQH